MATITLGHARGNIRRATGAAAMEGLERDGIGSLMCLSGRLLIVPEQLHPGTIALTLGALDGCPRANRSFYCRRGTCAASGHSRAKECRATLLTLGPPWTSHCALRLPQCSMSAATRVMVIQITHETRSQSVLNDIC